MVELILLDVIEEAGKNHMAGDPRIASRTAAQPYTKANFNSALYLARQETQKGGLQHCHEALAIRHWLGSLVASYQLLFEDPLCR